MVLRESPAAPRTLHGLKRTTTAPRPRRPASHDLRGGRVGGSVSVTPASASARCLPNSTSVCGFCAHVILVTMFLRHLNLLFL